MGTAAHGRLLRPLVVFGWLAALTAFELAVVALPFARTPTAVLLVGSALAKAALVALYFMHLRVERRLVHAIALLPVGIAVVFVLLLVPDIGVGYWR